MMRLLELLILVCLLMNTIITAEAQVQNKDSKGYLISNLKLEDQSQFCWNVELDDDTLFCYEMIHWPLTEEHYYNALEYDTQAKAKYKTLLDKWRETQLDETKTDPSNDCLAFSRFFYCSYYFPVCDSKEKPAQPLCDYVCSIWLLRCP